MSSSMACLPTMTRKGCSFSTSFSNARAATSGWIRESAAFAAKAGGDREKTRAALLEALGVIDAAEWEPARLRGIPADAERNPFG